MSGPLAAISKTLRIAVYNTGLSRKGPGLLARDAATGKDSQVEAVSGVIAATAPDVILLLGVDYDLGNAALDAVRARIAAAGQDYPYRFAYLPNNGMRTDLDINGDGCLRGPRDAQGFGYFAGADAMAILSKHPIAQEEAEDFSAFLWRDLPGSLIAGAALSDEAMAIQRLSTTGHWAVPISLPDGEHLVILAYHATPPVFDGPEDRNGRRNHDETRFWQLYLNGQLPFAPPTAPFVLLGDSNLDPADGDGRRDAMIALLADPLLQDPAPKSAGGAAAGVTPPNDTHLGDPALDTADWDEARGLGNMRVEFALPSSALTVAASGVWWPAPGTPQADQAAEASNHKLVWVDVILP